MLSIALALILAPGTAARPAEDVLALVPQPLSVKRAAGTFKLDVACP